jgi:hypothetical protein
VSDVSRGGDISVRRHVPPTDVGSVVGVARWLARIAIGKEKRRASEKYEHANYL